MLNLSGKKNFNSIWCYVLALCMITIVITNCGGGGGGGSSDSGSDGTEIPGGTNGIFVAGFHPQEPSSGGVAVIDPPTGTVDRIYTSPGDFLGIAVSPDDRFVVFTEYNSGYFMVYDQTDGSLDTYATRAGAFGVAISSDGLHALIVSTNAQPTVALFDLYASEGYILEIAPPPPSSGEFGSPRHIAITPDDSAAYIATGSYNHVVGTIAKMTGADEEEYQFEPIRTGGDPSWDLAITPDGRYLYCTSGGPRSDILKVNLYDTSDVTVIHLDPEKGKNTLGIAVSPDGRWVYATSNDTGYVAIIDAATDEVIKTVKAGNMASDVCFTSDGSRAYIASGHVYVIDCQTQELTGQPIDVGFRAYALATAN